MEGFSVGLYGWGVQLLVGFSYNYSFFLSANWLMNLVFAASTKRKKKKSGATTIFFQFSAGVLVSLLLEGYLFLPYLFRLIFLCDDKLNKNCGFEIIYLGIFSSFEMTIFFIKRTIFPQKNLNLTSSFPLLTLLLRAHLMQW